MNKATVKRHILEKHGKEQLDKLNIKTLPDHLNQLNTIHSDLNEKFGHKEA